MNLMRSLTIWVIFIGILATSLSAQNLKPQEIVDKHLAAIGTKEKRDSIKTLMATGLSEFEAKVPAVKGGGKAVMVSNPDNLFFVLGLNSREYPFEKVGFFGDKVNLPYSFPGTRSLLGSFLAENSKILSDGLFLGIMSLRWPFSGLEKRKIRIEAKGTKKIDGKKMYVLEFDPTGVGASSLKTRLYFDTETFNHVRSEYRRETIVGNVAFGQINQQGSSILTLTEEFSDFKNEDGLNLPHAYRATFQANSNAPDYENAWGMRVSQYYFNQQLAPDFFTFETK